jgi:hypothetical protein
MAHAAVPMDTGGEDAVVATFPVYLVRNPDPGGALYLLQSPLRPAARPYALQECDEVRFKVRLACDALGDAQGVRHASSLRAARRQAATTLGGGC